jgi:hypothetical protein
MSTKRKTVIIIQNTATGIKKTEKLSILYERLASKETICVSTGGMFYKLTRCSSVVGSDETTKINSTGGMVLFMNGGI